MSTESQSGVTQTAMKLCNTTFLLLTVEETGMAASEHAEDLLGVALGKGGREGLSKMVEQAHLLEYAP